MSIASEKKAAVTSKAGTWIEVAEAAAIIGRNKKTVNRLAKDGHIRTHGPAGLRPLYNRADCEALSPPPG